MLFRVLHRPLLQISSLRYLSKNSQRPRPESQHSRLWMLPGHLVLKKQILAKQYTLWWHPGLNTGIDHDRSIFALCDGIMVITEEKFKPDWNYHITDAIYAPNDVQEPVPEYMRYIHVIPKPRVSEFKLTDLV